MIEHTLKFDEEHNWKWIPNNYVEKFKMLQYGAICMSGEVGEFSNELKKIIRDFYYLDRKPNERSFKKLKEELIGVLIYLIELSRTLNMNMEKEFFAKMKTNKRKFKSFRK
jgi:NTP pyrophosphatase (non-canonical NTP hydrolase)